MKGDRLTWEQRLLIQSRERSDARNWMQRLADAYGENEMRNESRISDADIKHQMAHDQDVHERRIQRFEYSGVDNDPIDRNP